MNTVRLLAVIAMAVAGAGMAMAEPAEPPPGASSCSGCHTAKTGLDSAAPRIAGQPAAYIVLNMQAFKAGRRPATVMDRIAKGFTDPEIEAIAKWYEQQK